MFEYLTLNHRAIGGELLNNFTRTARHVLLDFLDFDPVARLVALSIFLCLE